MHLGTRNSSNANLFLCCFQIECMQQKIFKIQFLILNLPLFSFKSMLDNGVLTEISCASHCMLSEACYCCFLNTFCSGKNLKDFSLTSGLKNVKVSKIFSGYWKCNHGHVKCGMPCILIFFLGTIFRFLRQNRYWNCSLLLSLLYCTVLLVLFFVLCYCCSCGTFYFSSIYS